MSVLVAACGGEGDRSADGAEEVAQVEDRAQRVVALHVRQRRRHPKPVDAAEEEQILVQVHTSINMAEAQQRAANKRKQPATDPQGNGPASSLPNSEDQPAVGGLQLAQTTMDAAGGSSKRARAAGFEAPPDCKYHKLTQTQLKTAAEERGLVGKGPGQVPASSDKRRLHGALVAYDTAQAGAPGT